MKKINKIIHFFIIFILILQFFNFSSIAANAVVTSDSELGSFAESMITIEKSTGRVLYKKDEHKRLPMASTTKILTAIVAIENADDLNKKHEISKTACGIEGSSIYLKAGEHLSVLELLYGLMLRSGNDSAVAIAEIVAGSVEKFVQKMNDFCDSLGLENTHIVTVNGLHDDEHYTSAYDLAKITAYALNNEIFQEIVQTRKIKIDNEFSKYSDHVRVLVNKNKLLSMIDGADGVKIGYTKKAGKCFVGSATRGDMQVICVVLNSSNMFDGAAELINRAFKDFKLVKLLDKGELTTINVKNAKTQNSPVLLKKDIYFPLKSEEITKVKGKMVLNENLSAPLNETDEIGRIELWIQNNLIFSEKLYTINTEEKEGANDFIKKIIKSF